MVTPSDKVMIPFGGPKRTLSRYRKVVINTSIRSTWGGASTYCQAVERQQMEEEEEKEEDDDDDRLVVFECGFGFVFWMSVGMGF